MLRKAPYAAIALSLVGLATSFASALAPTWFAPYTERVFHGGGLLAVAGLVMVALLKVWKHGDEERQRVG